MLAHRIPPDGKVSSVTGTRGIKEPGGHTGVFPGKGGGEADNIRAKREVHAGCDRKKAHTPGPEGSCVSFPICPYFFSVLIARVTLT